MRVRAVEDLRVAPIRVLIAVLPESLIRPAVGDLAHAARVPGQAQRRFLAKRRAVARASLPPVGRRVDDGVLRRLGLVALKEIADPVDHGALREAIAGGSVRVVLNVQHARKGNAIAAPAATVGDKIVGLRRARRAVGQRKVVAAADEACIGRTGVLRVEAGRDVTSSLGGLVILSASYATLVVGGNTP